MKTWLSSLYLKLDQTTPQTTVGTLAFPNVKAKEKLLIGNNFSIKEHNTLYITLMGSSNTEYKGMRMSNLYTSASIYSPRLTTVNSNIVVTAEILYDSLARSVSILGGNAFSTATGVNQNGGNVIIRGGNKVGDGVYGNTYLENLNNGNVAIGLGTTIIPKSKLQVAGGIQCGDDTAAASADKVGTTRYRETANASYVEMCVRTSATTFEWQAIVTNTW